MAREAVHRKCSVNLGKLHNSHSSTQPLFSHLFQKMGLHLFTIFHSHGSWKTPQIFIQKSDFNAVLNVILHAMAPL